MMSPLLPNTQHLHLLTYVWLRGLDVEKCTFTRTAPEGIAVLAKEEALPNSTIFSACWDLAEKMEKWPTDRNSPNTETQVRMAPGTARPQLMGAIDRTNYVKAATD